MCREIPEKGAFRSINCFVKRASDPMNKVYNKILIATDGSSCSKKAALHAVELAKVTNARLLAVFVVDVKTGCGLEQCITVSTPKMEALGILRQRGERAIKHVEALAKKEGIDAEGHIIEGHPADEIIKLASAKSVDLIVMGTIGITGIKKYLLGSTADKVVRHSRIPVLTVRT